MKEPTTIAWAAAPFINQVCDRDAQPNDVLRPEFHNRLAMAIDEHAHIPVLLRMFERVVLLLESNGVDSSEIAAMKDLIDKLK